LSQNSPVAGWTSLDWEPVPQKEARIADSTPISSSLSTTGSATASAGQPIFTRSPRKRIAFPQESLTVQSPPGEPNSPSTSLLTILLPVMGSGIGIVLAITLAANSSPMAFVSLPMILFSVAAGVYNHYRQKKKYETAVANREASYRAYIANQRAKLSTWSTEQQRASLDPNPEPGDCLQLAKTRNIRLWERKPDDDDFLRIRLGIGRAKPTFELKTPEVPVGVLQPDPLISMAAELHNEFGSIPHNAVTLPLADLGSVGLIGNRSQLLAMTRALLMHIATHHAPNEVKLVLVLPDNEAGNWRWARWLPHVWNNDRTVRFQLVNDAMRHTHLGSLEELLKQRLIQASNTPSGVAKPAALPRYVFIFAAEKVWSGSERDAFSPLLDLLLTKGPELGAYTIFLTEQRTRVPKDCQALIEFDNTTRSCNFYSVRNPGACTDFVPDLVGESESNAFARALAPVQLETLSGAEQIPERVSITDLFGIGNIHDLSIEKLWDASQPTHTLTAPFGMRSGGKRAKIDLQDASKGGFGSHALVGGTTGTGKTRFLQTLILLMAAHYRPTDVQFVLIDFKGGDLMRGLENLPHVISSLTNIENQGNQADLIQRLFTSFDVEIRRRQALFHKFHVAGINSYMDGFASFGSEAEPLGHLFIIIDEFAELIIKNPDANLMKRLISLGQIGRSVGVHLILATQNPGTIIHEDLRNVLNTRICLRMGSREASTQILRRTDAFDAITKDQVGRAYIQVGNNDVFEPLQVAYGGAINNGGPDPSAQVLRMVAVDGQRKLLQTQATSINGEMQMQVLARQIIETAGRLGFQPQQGIWLPLLPNELQLDSLSVSGDGFDGTHWPQATTLAPILGLADDPQNRKQYPLHADLSANHHLLVYGGPGTGKTTMLHSLLVSAACQRSPRELSLYIMDFGGRNYSLFEKLPHTGAVITQGENERVRRLLTHIKSEFESRADLFQQNGVKSLEEFRKRHTDAPPDLLLVIDNYAGFYDAFVKNMMTTPELDVLVKISAEGGSLGIHLVIANTMVLSGKLSDPIKLITALELNAVQDYAQALQGLQGMTIPKGTRGRGLVRLPVADKAPRLLEFQAALPASGSTEYDRSQVMEKQFNQMAAAWDDKPRAYLIPSLPPVVPLAQLLRCEQVIESQSIPIPLGKNLASPDLAPFTISLEDGPHFWIAGPAYSGKSTLMQTWLLALSNTLPPQRFNFLLIDLADSGLSRLAGLPHCLGCINDREILKKNPVNPTQNPIEDCLKTASLLEEGGQLVIAIDDLALFNKLFDLNMKIADPTIRNFLVDIAESRKFKLTGTRNVQIHFIASGALSDFSSSANNPLADPIKRARSGFLIGTSDGGNAITYLGVKPGPADTGKPVAVGCGFSFVRGNVRPVMFATCSSTKAEFDQWIGRGTSAWQPPAPPGPKSGGRKKKVGGEG